MKNDSYHRDGKSHSVPTPGTASKTNNNSKFSNPEQKAKNQQKNCEYYGKGKK